MLSHLAQELADMTHIVCLSGGESSAIVAIEVCRKFGIDDVVLLNHDISSKVEDADVKRFKKEISNFDLYRDLIRPHHQYQTSCKPLSQQWPKILHR